MLASEHSEFECSLLRVRAEGEPSSDSNTDAAPCFSEGARHTTCSIVLLGSILERYGLPSRRLPNPVTVFHYVACGVAC